MSILFRSSMIGAFRSSFRSISSSQSLSSFSTLTAAISRRSFSTESDASSTSSSDKMIHSSYRIYRPTMAFELSVSRPFVTTLPNGNYSLKRSGTYILTFTPALRQMDQQNSGKKYDYTNKEFISLSLAEMGELIAFTRNFSKKTEFKAIRQPIKRDNDNNNNGESSSTTPETHLTKTLTIQRSMKEGGLGGYHVNFTVVRKENDGKESINAMKCFMTDGELVVITRLSEHVMPHLLAFGNHQSLSPALVVEDETTSSS